VPTARDPFVVSVIVPAIIMNDSRAQVTHRRVPALAETSTRVQMAITQLTSMKDKQPLCCIVNGIYTCEDHETDIRVCYEHHVMVKIHRYLFNGEKFSYTVAIVCPECAKKYPKEDILR